MADKKDIAKAGAVSGASTVLPYVAVIGGGLLAYKYLKDNTPNFIGGGGGGGSGPSFYESIKETVKEIAGGNSTDPTTLYNLLLNPEMLPESENQEIYEDNPNTDSQSSTGTAGEWADFLTKGPIGAGFNVISQIGTAINPMPADLKNTQKKLGSGNFSIGDIANPDNPINKFLGFTKSSYASKAGEVQSVNVSDIKTREQAVSMGLGNAPLAVNANPKIDANAVSNKNTNKSITAKQLKASGMPASNLKNATSVSTVTDKSGKERIKIKYKNGVTLKY
jgi:hypothetical protein